jgi:ubiquinone/menaquinone biosynthesis C-methylase UbiE
MDVAAIKERMARVWGMGDYSYLSDRLAPASQALCDACAVSAGQEVLDVAAGDGNFALACAREGASVMASDLSPGMVERGRARTAAEGFEIDWVVADAEELPFEDGRFDCVGSVFGAMIAPRPDVVARVLFRVVRPGGTVGMTAWTPESFTAGMFGIGRKYLPPPPGQPAPEEWGSEEIARQRLEGHAARLEFERRTSEWHEESPESLADAVAESAATWVAAKESLPPEQFAAAQGELRELARRWGGDGPLRIESEYLVIVARKRG